MFFTSGVFACNAILNRALKMVSPNIIMFYHGIIGISIALVAILSEAWFIQRDTSEIRLYSQDIHITWLLIAASVLDVVALYCMTIAYQSYKSGFVALIMYVSIVYSFLADIFLFK